MIESSTFYNSVKFNKETMEMEYTSPFIGLVREIEKRAEERGLTLSRWQTNGQNHRTTVTYMLHSGERAAQARLQGGDVFTVTLSALEGATPRCEAYKALEKAATGAGLL